MNKPSCIIFVLIFLLPLSCGLLDSNDSGSTIPEYTQLELDNLPTGKILNVPTREAIAKYSYLESFSMQIAYIDNTITTAEVFTFAGCGAIIHYSVDCGAFGSQPPYPESPHRWALNNFGLNYILGSASEEGYGNLYANASGRISYASKNEALLYLKAVINSNRPVQVFIDMGSQTIIDYQGIRLGDKSQYVLVTGYDSTGVYVNEPYVSTSEAETSKNIRFELVDFMEVWKRGGNINVGAPDQAGPYWMLFLVEQTSTELRKMSVAEILARQKELSAGNAATIENNLDSDFSNTNWTMIANAKKLFGDYLIKKSYPNAGKVYHTLDNEYRALSRLTTDAVQTKLNETIKPLEIEAREKF